MPRIHLGARQPRLRSGELVDQLAYELKGHRATGQPLIYEKEFEGGAIRTTVIWDAWESLSLEDRTSIILSAYTEAEGSEYRSRVALASGLTVPEATSAGMLPFQVITAIRTGDSVTLDECRKAMMDVGASTLLDQHRPQLRFATLEEAEATVKELVSRLPHSEPVWVTMQDFGSLDDWVDR